MAKFDAKKLLVYILVPLLIAVMSVGVVAKKAPEWGVFKTTLESLDDSKETVMKMSGVALGTSVAITLLPDDYASPIANELADMETYFILILAAIFLERLIAVEGIGLACAILIPIACLCWALSGFVKREFFHSLAKRILVLGVAVLFIIPVSTQISDNVCAEYLAYVDETIAETDDGVAVITDTMQETAEGQSILDKLSNALTTAVNSVEDMVEYFKNVVKQFVNSIAILIVADCLIPLLTLMLFVWLIKQLFGIEVMPLRIMGGLHFGKLHHAGGVPDEKE